MRGIWFFLGVTLFFAVIGYTFNGDETNAQESAQKKIFKEVSGVVLNIEEDYLLLGPADSEIEAVNWRMSNEGQEGKPVKLYFLDDRRPLVQEGAFVQGFARDNPQSPTYSLLDVSAKVY
ncbi:hypothetical protein LGQ02_13835 [Bacillus shivajii]|uniref:hypothetical protein n=1 Tax=Bacillus shivajii TaxID=1983719 RepID=UPI001CFA41A3|nr:hypothetical protein [Bacillus shivajii]UCZ51931.1 hypothetical protein LGQ02_13835 [Bacillus shivajii]